MNKEMLAGQTSWDWISSASRPSAGMKTRCPSGTR